MFLLILIEVVVLLSVVNVFMSLALIKFFLNFNKEMTFFIVCIHVTLTMILFFYHGKTHELVCIILLTNNNNNFLKTI